MEYIVGRRRGIMGGSDLAARAAGYPYAWVDLGTGDGRYVRHLAAAMPRWLVLGVDSCREQLRERSRATPPNALFVIADALGLPSELDGLANRVSVNFPWGSLLDSLLEGDPRLIGGLGRICRPDALLEVRLNGGALAERGLTAEEGGARLRELLGAAGWSCAAPAHLEARELRSLATSWARRLAFGREPWAIGLRAVRAAGAHRRGEWH